MNKKLLAMIGAAILSIFVISGCNTNDQDPPPDDDTELNENGVNDRDDNNNVDLNDDNDRAGNGDPVEDNNTNREEIIEDRGDVVDDDNRDE